MEVPHTGWLRLYQLSSDCFVEHRGTGEVHKLPGNWELSLHDGKGYVAPVVSGPEDVREQCWVNTLFDKSLHHCLPER